MKLKKKETSQFILALFCVVVLVITGFIYLNFIIKENLSKFTCNTLEEIMHQQAYNFTSKLSDEKLFIKALSEELTFSRGIDDISVSDLSRVVNDTSFDFLAIADKNGHAFNSFGEKFYVGDLTFFIESMQGKNFISSPLIASIWKHNVLIISSPLVERTGKIIGVFFGSYNADKLNELFLSSFGGKGYAFITDNEGNIVASTKNEYTLSTGASVFVDWEKANFYANDSYETMRQNLYLDKGGHSKYEFNGHRRLMHYATIGINYWNIFSIVPDEVISVSAQKIIDTSYVLTVVFILAFILLAVWLVNMHKKHVQELWKIAFVDELTNVPTLAKFKLEAQALLKKNPEKRYLLIKKDIDRFKLINQVFGYAEGNEILKNMAGALESCLSEKDVFARINIDEFIILLEYISGEQLAEKRKLFLDTFYKKMGENFKYNMSFPAGYYYIDQNEEINIIAAFENVNIAHKKAKALGMEICIYDDNMKQEALDVKDIENKMEEALNNGEFKMFLQAKRYLRDEKIAGAEALVRWWSNGHLIMHPGSFIPVFEKNGFVVKLDMFMFEEACKFIAELLNEGKEPLTISINFSRLHLQNENFVQDLCLITDKYKMPRNYLEVEITETAILDNEDAFNVMLEKLHLAGFTISMDDFGTGYSSLGLLKNIAFDVIKIDRSFFIEASKPERARLVLSNVIKMAKDLGIHTVAEGVENVEHIQMLREIGCDIVQGYYYAKPIPCDEFKVKEL